MKLLTWQQKIGWWRFEWWLHSILRSIYTQWRVVQIPSGWEAIAPKLTIDTAYSHGVVWSSYSHRIRIERECVRYFALHLFHWIQKYVLDELGVGYWSIMAIIDRIDCAMTYATLMTYGSAERRDR